MRRLDRRTFKQDVSCVDCGIDTIETDEYYMVHDKVWPIGAADGMLCIGCLEVRIGRRLTPEDFTSAPCNHIFEVSDRLRDRLGRS